VYTSLESLVFLRMGHWWGTRAQQISTFSNLTQHLSLAMLPSTFRCVCRLSVWRDSYLRGDSVSLRERETSEVSHGWHVIGNKN